MFVAPNYYNQAYARYMHNDNKLLKTQQNSGYAIKLTPQEKYIEPDATFVGHMAHKANEAFDREANEFGHHNYKVFSNRGDAIAISAKLAQKTNSEIMELIEGSVANYPKCFAHGFVTKREIFAKYTPDFSYKRNYWPFTFTGNPKKFDKDNVLPGNVIDKKKANHQRIKDIAYFFEDGIKLQPEKIQQLIEKLVVSQYKEDSLKTEALKNLLISHFGQDRFRTIQFAEDNDLCQYIVTPEYQNAVQQMKDPKRFVVVNYETGRIHLLYNPPLSTTCNTNSKRNANDDFSHQGCLFYCN